MLEAMVLVIFPFSMAFAAISDLMSMTIQNRVSLLLAGSFIVIAPLAGLDWTAFAWHWAAALTVLLVTFGLFALGTMGGGDAKLMASTALWMGFGPPLIEYLMVASLIGGALTLAILALRSSSIATLSGAERFLPHLTEKKNGVPYGVALGAAGLLTCADSDLMKWALSQLSA